MLNSLVSWRVSRYWISGFFGFLLGFLVFVFLYLLPPKSWEAVGVIRIGQALKTGSASTVALGLLMSPESSRQLIVSKAESIIDAGALSKDAVSYRTRSLPENLIELKVYAPSGDLAKKKLQDIFSEFKWEHDELFQERQKFWLKEASRISGDIIVSNKLLANQDMVCQNFGNKSVEYRLFCLNLIAGERYRLDRLANSLRSIEEYGLQSWTYPSDLFSSVRVSGAPVSPQVWLVILLSLFAAVGGFVLAEVFL